jgi:hypothetical protein
MLYVEEKFIALEGRATEFWQIRSTGTDQIEPTDLV